MTLLGILEDDEYLPEYGTLVVRDRYAADALAPLGNELLGELATEALSGTVATAGDGWVHGHAGLELTAAEINALANLADGEGCTVSRLAALVGARPTTLTSVLDRLERRGHVTRGAVAGDRRSVLVELTGSGRAAADTVRRTIADLEHRALGALPPAAVAKLPRGPACAGGGVVMTGQARFQELLSEVMAHADGFGHHQHVHLTWPAVRRYGTAEAVEVVSDGIRRTAGYAGRPQKYHAAISRAWVELIGHHVAESETTDFASFADQDAALPDSACSLASTAPPPWPANRRGSRGWSRTSRPFLGSCGVVAAAAADHGLSCSCGAHEQVWRRRPSRSAPSVVSRWVTVVPLRSLVTSPADRSMDA